MSADDQPTTSGTTSTSSSTPSSSPSSKEGSGATSGGGGSAAGSSGSASAGTKSSTETKTSTTGARGPTGPNGEVRAAPGIKSPASTSAPAAKAPTTPSAPAAAGTGYTRTTPDTSLKVVDPSRTLTAPGKTSAPPQKSAVNAPGTMPGKTGIYGPAAAGMSYTPPATGLAPPSGPSDVLAALGVAPNARVSPLSHPAAVGSYMSPLGDLPPNSALRTPLSGPVPDAMANNLQTYGTLAALGMPPAQPKTADRVIGTETPAPKVSPDIAGLLNSVGIGPQYSAPPGIDPASAAALSASTDQWNRQTTQPHTVMGSTAEGVLRATDVSQPPAAPSGPDDFRAPPSSDPYQVAGGDQEVVTDVTDVPELPQAGDPWTPAAPGAEPPPPPSTGYDYPADYQKAKTGLAGLPSRLLDVLTGGGTYSGLAPGDTEGGQMLGGMQDGQGPGQQMDPAMLLKLIGAMQQQGYGQNDQLRLILSTFV